MKIRLELYLFNVFFLSVILIFDGILPGSNFLVCLHCPDDCCENCARLINT